MSTVKPARVDSVDIKIARTLPSWHFLNSDDLVNPCMVMCEFLNKIHCQCKHFFNYFFSVEELEILFKQLQRFLLMLNCARRASGQHRKIGVAQTLRDC